MVKLVAAAEPAPVGHEAASVAKLAVAKLAVAKLAVAKLAVADEDSDPGMWCQIIGKLQPVNCPRKAGAMESQSPQKLFRNRLTTISCDVSDAHHIFKHTS